MIAPLDEKILYVVCMTQTRLAPYILARIWQTFYKYQNSVDTFEYVGTLIIIIIFISYSKYNSVLYTCVIQSLQGVELSHYSQYILCNIVSTITESKPSNVSKPFLMLIRLYKLYSIHSHEK